MEGKTAERGGAGCTSRHLHTAAGRQGPAVPAGEVPAPTDRRPRGDPGQERCLYVYALGDFAENAAARPADDHVKGARDRGRFLGANANQDTPDKQGRVTITPMQRDYASLTRDVMVLGAIDRIEIWDPARWESYNQQNQETFADISEEVFPRA